MPTKKHIKKEETFDEELEGEEGLADEMEEDESEPLDDPLEESALPPETEEPPDSIEEDLADDEPKEEPLGREVYQMSSDVPVQVVVVMGKKTISVKDLAEFKMGQVIDLARPVNEMVDVIAGGKLVAKGELVDIDGKMGVRVVKMVR